MYKGNINFKRISKVNLLGFYQITNGTPQTRTGTKKFVIEPSSISQVGLLRKSLISSARVV